ncbi:MAG TPA: ribosome recycling factor [Acidobacteriota bacterium]|jgi:ribosome recycling factor|nr:ribosome recycling factor [Acidobacteriota bacterium]
MTKQIINEAKGRMKKTIDDLTHDLASIRTGRASVHLLDSVTVDYYGTQTPVNQVASLHAPEPNLITVQPWDVSQITQIERAIMASNLGLNPNNDGKIIRVPVPPLTEERRHELARQVSKIAEDHRTAIRQIRRDGNDQLKKSQKAKEISEDEEYRAHDEVQELTNEFVKDIDALAKQKEEEILTG